MISPIYSSEAPQHIAFEWEKTVMNVFGVRDLIPPEVPFFSPDAKLSIHPEDVIALEAWTPTTGIRIDIGNMFWDYPFKLINAETGTSIRVKVVK
jgi:hypothetical protein